MHLVEAEDVGPIEGDAPAVTPPRPPHRRVSVSLLFTLSVLTGLVVAIYTLLPARQDEIITEALRQHRIAEPTWDLAAPTPKELRAWAIGVVGKDVPLPAETNHIVGARRIEVVHRAAALMRLRIDGNPITVLVQHSRGIRPEHVERTEGDLRALSWRRGKFTFVAVGPAATAGTWVPALRH
jgi:hypothetical protein